MMAAIRRILGAEPADKAESNDKAEPIDRASVSISEIPEDPPKFRRDYRKKLDGRASCTISMRSSWSRRFSFGELTQPDGRWVMFDPERVAEKILDPSLVPLIEEFTKQVFSLDRDFIKSNPSKFADENGLEWHKIRSQKEEEKA